MTLRWSSTWVVRRRDSGALLTSAPIWSSQSAAGQAGDPAAALFIAAEAVRVAGRADEAISSYQRIMAEYPSSPWAARSALEAARSMVGQGKWESAMRQMEIVRLGFTGTPEAEQALEPKHNPASPSTAARPACISFRTNRCRWPGIAATSDQRHGLEGASVCRDAPVVRSPQRIGWDRQPGNCQ